MKKQKLPVRAMEKSSIDASELETITKQITARFPTEKVICFGSIVNNIQNTSCFSPAETHFENPSQKNSYYLLVVPDSSLLLGDIGIQMQLEDDLKALANVTIIVHRMQDINTALENGSSFFTTIYRKGTVLYDQEAEAFAVPGPGAEISKRIIKRENFWHQWHNLSEGFLKGAVFFQNNGHLNLSVYMLHQALQHCYSGMLRVLTGYRTNTNGLRRLMKLIDNILPESSFTTNHKTPEDTRLTGLLLKGFGDARYSEKFEVNHQELSLMIERITNILSKGNDSCLKHLKQIKEGTSQYIA